jgi:hypothetical protein
LRTDPILDRSFAKGHLARRIAIVPCRIKHARKYGWISAIRGAETEGDVTERIHGDASHPAMNSISNTRRVSALLENNRAAIGVAQLPPANT